MLKVYDYSITFAEFPDEIALCLNISNCPCYCEGCSESYLKDDVGKEITQEFIDSLLTKYKDYSITLIGFMGGDSDHKALKEIASYIKEKYQLLIGFYSGFDSIDIDLISVIDYYKYGRFILPKPFDDSSKWHLKSGGPINFPWSNQRMLKKINNNLVDITERFRTVPLGDLKRHIIQED